MALELYSQLQTIVNNFKKLIILQHMEKSHFHRVLKL